MILHGIVLIPLILHPALSSAEAYGWVAPAIATCEAMGVSGTLALAVILTESQGQPYAIRINAGAGVSIYPATYEVAQHVATLILLQTDNIDLGLMQVNYRHHGHPRGLTPAELLQPHVNLRVGCSILKDALASSGPIWQRLGRYHSGSPTRQWAYALRVTRWLKMLTKEE
jgi:soluble lytic murein transglycosylase-like protein